MTGSIAECEVFASRFFELEQAMQHNTSVALTYRVAGLEFKVVYLNAEIMDLLSPSLSHIQVSPEGKPRLTIYAANGAGSLLPQKPLSSSTGQAEFYRFNSENYKLQFRVLGKNCAEYLLNTDADIAIFFYNKNSALDLSDLGSPFLPILFPWLLANDVCLLHAAGIGHDNGSILICGKSGSGKSTTAIAAATLGYDYSGDDYIAVKLGNPFVLSSIYNSFKLEPASIRILEMECSFRLNTNSEYAEKQIFFAHCLPGIQMLNNSFLKGIVFPQLGRKATPSLAPITAAEAFRLLAPSNLIQLPFADSNTAMAITKILQGVPSYRLTLGHSLKDSVYLLKELL